MVGNECAEGLFSVLSDLLLEENPFLALDPCGWALTVASLHPLPWVVPLLLWHSSLLGLCDMRWSTAQLPPYSHEDIHTEMCSLHIGVLVFSATWCGKKTEQEANFPDDERARLSFCLWGPSWYTSLSSPSMKQNCWSGLLFSMCSRNDCTLETKSFSYTPPIGGKAIFSHLVNANWHLVI